MAKENKITAYSLYNVEQKERYYKRQYHKNTLFDYKMKVEVC